MPRQVDSDDRVWKQKMVECGTFAVSNRPWAHGGRLDGEQVLTLSLGQAFTLIEDLAPLI